MYHSTTETNDMFSGLTVEEESLATVHNSSSSLSFLWINILFYAVKQMRRAMFFTLTPLLLVFFPYVASLSNYLMLTRPNYARRFLCIFIQHLHHKKNNLPSLKRVYDTTDG
jgi:hypothetical protein